MRFNYWKVLPVLAGYAEAAQCQASLSTALSVAQRLQNHYFNPLSGQYNDGLLWTDANALEDLHNLMLATNTDEFESVANQSYIGKAALNPDTDWKGILNGGNGDAAWIVLALWKIADYKHSRGLNESAAYIDSSKKLYDIISGQWDDDCGGGVWYRSNEHTYKNTNNNGLFLLLSAVGYVRFHETLYLDYAKKTWKWLSESGIMNSDGLWNDGLDMNTCKNNGQTTWTYNQGVVASGLGALYAATGDASLLVQAEITFDATMAHLTSNNILREPCDDVTTSVCSTSQQAFKGIWTKHLQYYLDTASSEARVNKYKKFLGEQEAAILHSATNSTGDIGSTWYAPAADAGGTLWTPMTSTSGLAAHIAAAKYGPC